MHTQPHGEERPVQDRILDAASRVFSQKGYHKACMDDIAAQADVAKGSLYYHFRNKSRLFSEVAVRGMESLRRELEEAAGMNVPVEDKVASVVDRVSALCYDYSDLFTIIMSEMPEGIDGDAWERIQETRRGLLDYLSALLREGCETEGSIRPLEFDVATHALMGFIYAYLRQYKGGDRDKALREIRDVIMHGIMADR
jgi:AcrR family transcriptional regulator